MAHRGFTLRIDGPAGAESAALARRLEVELQTRGCRVELFAEDEGQTKAARAEVETGAGVVRIEIAGPPQASDHRDASGSDDALVVHVIREAGKAYESFNVAHGEGQTDLGAARVIAALEEMQLVARPEAGYTEEDEEEVRRRLEALGYV
jgi:hypothetical protein